MGGFRRFVVGCVVAGLVFVPTAAVAAFDPTQSGGGDAEGGLWYVRDQGLEAAHAAGFRGQGVKVAVIDSRINPEVPELVGANLKIREPAYCVDDQGLPFTAATSGVGARHGTAMASLIVGTGAGGGIVGIAPDVELLYYAALLHWRDYSETKVGTSEAALCFTADGKSDHEMIAAAINQAVTDGADIISMSFGSELGGGVFDALTRAQREGVMLVAGYSNKEEAAGHAMNAANGVVTVMSYDAAGELRAFDDSGGVGQDDAIDIVAPGVDILGRNPIGSGDWESVSLSTGNSNATAITAGVLAVLKSKYPGATNNQILQSVLHNTGPDDHELWRDQGLAWGYGPINLAHALRVDPAQYDDTNPLLLKGKWLSPSYGDVTGDYDSEIGGTPGPSGEATGGSKGPAGGAGVSDSSPTVLWVGLGLGVLVVLGAVLVIVLVVRARRKPVQQAYPVQPWQQGGPPPFPPDRSFPPDHYSGN